MVARQVARSAALATALPRGGATAAEQVRLAGWRAMPGSLYSGWRLRVGRAIDAAYLRSRNLATDLSVMLQGIPTVLTRDGAG